MRRANTDNLTFQDVGASPLIGVNLSDLNPYVVTFGQPPTIDAPCPLITSERWYRYINTRTVESGLSRVVYDPIPFADSGAMALWGHMIVLGDDSQHVTYIGLNAQDEFKPLDINGLAANSMMTTNGTANPGYLDRIQAIIKAYETGIVKSYPVKTSGFAAGFFCVSSAAYPRL